MLGLPEDELLRKLARRDTGFVYLARKVPAGEGATRAEARARRARVHPRVPARLPARLDGLAAARRRSAPTARGWPGSSTRSRTCARAAPTASAGSSRTRSATRSRCATSSRPSPGERRAADARRRHPGPRRGRCSPRSARVAAQGRDGDRDGSARRLDPRARQLAAGERQRARRRARLRHARTARSASTYEPGSTFKAFTVAGRAGGRQGHAGHAVQPRRRRSSRRPRDPRVEHARPRSTARRADPQGVQQRRRDRDRPAARRQALRLLGAPFGFGKPTGVDLPGEESGIVLPLVEVLGLLDGQPADRPGHRGHADADGRRLLGDRQRRRAAPAAHRRGRRRRAGARARAASGSSPRPPSASLRKMLEGVLGPGGTASGAAIQGYDLAGKTGTAQKVDPRGGYSTAQVRRLVRRLRARRRTRSCSSP